MEQAKKKIKRLSFKLFFDGASKGNPGPSATGWVLKNEKGENVSYGWRYLGDKITNNTAEYEALIDGLRYVNSMPAYAKVEVFGDSNLVIQQVRGDYECTKEHLQKLRSIALGLINDSQHKFTFSHILREFNDEADKLSKKGIRLKNTYVHRDIDTDSDNDDDNSATKKDLVMA